MTEWEKDREACEAATPGPWEIQDLRHPDDVADGTADDTFWVRGLSGSGQDDDCIARKDAAFIARARDRWPEALVEIDRLRRVAEAARLWLAADEVLRSLETEEGRFTGRSDDVHHADVATFRAASAMRVALVGCYPVTADGVKMSDHHEKIKDLCAAIDTVNRIAELEREVAREKAARQKLNDGGADLIEKLLACERERDEARALLREVVASDRLPPPETEVMKR